jgi:hypothetical protein
MPSSGWRCPSRSAIVSTAATAQHHRRCTGAAHGRPPGCHRHVARASRRHRQGAGKLRVLVRPRGQRAPCGGPPCAPRTRTPASCDRRVEGVEDRRRRGRDHRRRRPRRAHLRPDQPRPAGVRERRRALRGGARRCVAADHPETCRRALEAIEVTYEVLDAAPRSGGRHRRQRRSDPSRRQRDPPPAHRLRRPRRHRHRWWSREPTNSACRTRRSSASRPRSPSPTRRGWGGAAHGHPVVARGSRQIAACLGLPEDAGPARARRCRRSVRRPRGHLAAGAHLPARPASRQTGADGLRPRGELPRSRAPPSGHHLDASPRHRRR